MRRIRLPFLLALALALTVSPLSAAPAPASGDAATTGDVTLLERHEFLGGGEVDFDGRYAYVGQASLAQNLRRRNVMLEDSTGGIRIIDLEGEVDTETGETVGQFEEVGFLDCPGTDNYVRVMDPEVFNPEDLSTQYIVVSFHGNACTRDELLSSQRSANGHGARNGIMIVDVTDRTDPQIVDVIGHYSAHTVMPHPTRPYIYILPGGTANGTDTQRLAPTGIIDASDPENLVVVNDFEHNAQGCHDLGWTVEGDYAYCAGIGEVQVWDVRGENIEDPIVVNSIVNPAIQFAHNAVVSPDNKYMLVNDEAFGFHTCSGESADLYGSLWIYDISTPDLPILAGRISPPKHPDPNHRFGTLENTPVQEGWAQSWCAAHNYNFVPGTNVVVASWFAGGMTAHDISNPLSPELIADYQPADGVMWSAHYYGGFVVTGDMRRGTDIVDIPALRAAEAAAAPADGAGGEALGLGSALGGMAPALRRDMTDVLVPAILPPRDLERTSSFCSIPL
jgi:hypothetical protein